MGELVSPTGASRRRATLNEHPESRSPAVSGRPSARFAFCTAWPGGALAEVVERADDDPGPGRAVGEDADLGAVGALDARELGRDPLRQHGHGGRCGVRRLERLAQIGGRGHVTGREQPALHRQQVRDEADREAERLRDLGRVLMRPDLVRRDVLEHGGRVRGRLQRPPGAGDARLRVDDDAGRLDRVHERREREQDRGRVAAGVRDQRALPAGTAPGSRSSSRRARPAPGARSRTTRDRARRRRAGARPRGRRRRRRPAARARPPARARGSRRRARRRPRAPPRS